MKAINLLLILLVLNSCGQYALDEGVIQLDSESTFIINDDNRCFECMEIQEEFLSELAINNSSIAIGFAKMQESKAGACYIYKDGTAAFIKINKEIWDSLSPNVKKTLIYHELGHCHLGLDHLDDYEVVDSIDNSFSALIKLSIMNSTIMSPFQATYAIKYWDEYTHALINDEVIQYPQEIVLEEMGELHYEDIKGFNIPIELLKETATESGHINESLYFPRLCDDDKNIYRSLFSLEKETECYITL